MDKLTKIQGIELQEFAAGDSDQQRSVFIEPDVPPRRVVFDPVKRAITESTAPEEQETTEMRTAQLREYLEDLLETPPNWIDSARTFVARVTPERLRLIAQHPAVGMIEENKEYKAPRDLGVNAGT
jgi:hypothetical protein